GHGHTLTRSPAKGLDRYLRGDGRRPDAQRFGPEAHQIADLHRLMEHHLVHGDGEHHAAALPARFDGAGLVDVGEDDAAEDGAVRVGVARHHEHADGGLVPFRRYINQYYSPACCGACCLSSESLMLTLASLRRRCSSAVRRLRASCWRSTSPYDV